MLFFFLVFSLFGVSGVFGYYNPNYCNLDEFLNVSSSRELVELKEPLYRFSNGYIHVGKEPFTFWMPYIWMPNRNKILSPDQFLGNTNVVLQLYGRKDCETHYFFEYPHGLYMETPPSCPCHPYEYDNNKYVPVKIWTLDNPLYVKVDTELDRGMPMYIFKEEMEKLKAAVCANNEFLVNNYQKEYNYWVQSFGYHSRIAKVPVTKTTNATFFNEKGKDYLRLNNNVSVVWVIVDDATPKHFLLIETQNGEFMKETFQVGIEANGKDPEKNVTNLPNGVKVEMVKERCRSDYDFIAYIRYIITVDEVGMLKASFYDSKSGKNLPLYSIDVEADGIPKVTPQSMPTPVQITMPKTTTLTPSTAPPKTTQKGKPNGNEEEPNGSSRDNVQGYLSMAILIPIFAVYFYLG